MLALCKAFILKRWCAGVSSRCVGLRLVTLEFKVLRCTVVSKKHLRGECELGNGEYIGGGYAFEVVVYVFFPE